MTERSHVLAACLVLTAFATLAGCHEKQAPEAVRAPVNVDVVDIALRDVPVVFDYVGQTESSQQVEIRARVNGFLEKRVYQEGSMVHQGDVMFVMDRKPFEASLDAARAEFAQQKARLDTAQANLNRVRPLVAKNALSQKDLDDSIGQQEAAAAALEQARANVTSANLNLDAERSLFAAQLQQSQLQDLELAQIVALYKALGYGWSVDTASQAPAAG